MGSQSPGIHSLVVLPLENLSRDPEQQYFADGMTDHSDHRFIEDRRAARHLPHLCHAL